MKQNLQKETLLFRGSGARVINLPNIDISLKVPHAPDLNVAKK
jgi:hypothetical protein